MRGKCLLKYRWKLKKKMFVNLDRHVFWTPFPDENFIKINKRKKKGGGFWSRVSENKWNPNHDSRKLKFAIFENFTNNGESIRDINEGSRE